MLADNTVISIINLSVVATEADFFAVKYKYDAYVRVSHITH